MAYCAAILEQMVRLFSKYKSEKLVREHGAEYHARGVRSWSHFAAMLHGQLAYLNAHRPHSFFRAVFLKMLSKC